jgi:hypothetical protein
MTRGGGPGIHLFRVVKVEKNRKICIRKKKMYRFAIPLYKYTFFKTGTSEKQE